MDVGFVEYVSELVLINFCCTNSQGMGKHAPLPTCVIKCNFL